MLGVLHGEDHDDDAVVVDVVVAVVGGDAGVDGVVVVDVSKELKTKKQMDSRCGCCRCLRRH
jgi:hypothetical protein